MKISVCMATYNGEKFLKEQLDSILPQLSSDDEVVISDDGSTDGTLQIIRAYRDKRIQLFHSTHKNLIFNFENALKRARGDVIFLSDQDDIWVDGKVEKSLGRIEKYTLVFSNALRFQGRNTSDSELFFKRPQGKTGILNNVYKSNFIGATMVFKKSVLKKALPFPKNLAMHDIWIGLIAESAGSTFYIDEPLIYYRRHETNASFTGEKSGNSLFKKLKIRLVLVINLSKRLWFGK